MKKAVLFLMMALATPAMAGGEADLEKGREAFRRGMPGEALPHFRAAAEQGNALAAYNIGVLYLNGEGVPADKAQAFTWFRRAAEAGNGDAQFNMGLAHELGDGLPRDNKAAHAWYEKAARNGNVRAAARMILVSLPPPPAYTPPSPRPASFDEAFYKGLAAADRGDHAEAFRWWQYTAREGRETSAMKNIGLLYFDGLGVPRNRDEARRWWAEAAVQGDNADAMYFLGVVNNFGEGTPRDLALARLWYEAAQKQGHRKAAAALTALALDEAMEGGLRSYKAGDFATARAQFEKAAAAGRTDAMMYRGLMASQGSGGPASDEEAVRWYRKAADADDKEGMIALSKMYFHGTGVPRDSTEAIGWLRRAQAVATDEKERQSLEYQIDFIRNLGRTETFKATERAARNGNEVAMLRLGQYYRHGQEGAPKDMQQALQWMEGAAHAGSREAMFGLREIYSDGPHKDKKRANFWDQQLTRVRQAEDARKRAALDAYLAESTRQNHEYRMKNDPAYRSQVEYQQNAWKASRSESIPGPFQDAMWRQSSWNYGGGNIGGGAYTSQRTSASGDRVIEIKFR